MWYYIRMRIANVLCKLRLAVLTAGCLPSLSQYLNLVTRPTLGTTGLSVVSKLLEKHICDLLYEHLDISDQQWGFQACKSTTNAILSATNEWFSRLRMGKKCRLYSLTSEGIRYCPPLYFDRQTLPTGDP